MPSDQSNPYPKNSIAWELREIGSGRRPMPSSGAKNHHFVPQFLLARFASPPTKEGRLIQLDKGSGVPRAAKVSAVASRRRFYAVETTEAEADNRIEDFLGLVERHAAPAISKLLEDPGSLRAHEIVDIGLLLVLQEQRSPAGLARTTRRMEEVGQQLATDLLTDPGRFIAEAREYGLELSDEELEAARENLANSVKRGGLRLERPEQEAWRLMIDSFLEAGEIPLHMTWFLLQPGAGEFITSDRALSMFDPDPVLVNDWMSSPHAETAFPLAPNACLVLLPGTHGLTRRVISEKEVDQRRRDGPASRSCRRSPGCGRRRRSAAGRWR